MFYRNQDVCGDAVKICMWEGLLTSSPRQCGRKWHGLYCAAISSKCMFFFVVLNTTTTDSLKHTNTHTHTSKETEFPYRPEEFLSEKTSRHRIENIVATASACDAICIFWIYRVSPPAKMCTNQKGSRPHIRIMHEPSGICRLASSRGTSRTRFLLATTYIHVQSMVYE